MERRIESAAQRGVEAVSDVLGATVSVVANTGETAIRGAGRIAGAAVDETTSVLSGVAGNLNRIGRTIIGRDR